MRAAVGICDVSMLGKIEIFGADAAGIVAEGRDITTVVAPDADVRVLLSASEDERMRRRAAELSLEESEETRARMSDQVLRRDRCVRIVEAATANARNYHLSGPRRLLGHAALKTANRIAPRAVFERFAWVYDFDPTAVS